MLPISIPPAIESALADVKARLRARLGPRLSEVRLFGSVARGEAHGESDIDVLVIVDRVDGSLERIDILDVVSHVAVEHALPIETVVLGEAELDTLRRRETAFAAALDRDGIAL